MLAKKVVVAAALAVGLSAAAGVAHGAALLLHFYGASNRWVAVGLTLFTGLAFIVGLGAGVFAYVHAPKKPPGWRTVYPCAIERLAPAAVYFGTVILCLALYKYASRETADAYWRVVGETSAGFSFTLITWENLWVWRQWTR
jgi:hypothetical protein